MGSSVQIALFVAPVLVLLSYSIAPSPMDLSFAGGQAFMVLMTTLTVAFVVATGQSPGTRASSSSRSTPSLPRRST